MSCRSGDVGWPQGLDVAFGVCRDLSGISLGQAGLGSGGAAQVGLVHSNMTHLSQRYEPLGSGDGYTLSGPWKGVTPCLDLNSNQNRSIPYCYESMRAWRWTIRRALR